MLPLAFDLVPQERRAAVAERLARDITEHRTGHAYVGVIGAAYILPVLTATGHHEVAVTVATNTTEPSWGYWTDALKFTALGESWPASTRSRNHHFFGAIVQWFYEDLAGIRPLEPGYPSSNTVPRYQHLVSIMFWRRMRACAGPYRASGVARLTVWCSTLSCRQTPAGECSCLPVIQMPYGRLDQEPGR